MTVAIRREKCGGRYRIKGRTRHPNAREELSPAGPTDYFRLSKDSEWRLLDDFKQGSEMMRSPL